MINKEFQELNRLYSIAREAETRSNLLEQMRKNLIQRNQGEGLYTFSYTQEGLSNDILTADYNGCLQINGDMNPMGL